MLDDIRYYLSLNLKDYENIGIDFEINKFLLLAGIVLCVASFVINRKRALLSEMIKQLFRHGATSEEGAKTLGELGLSASRGIRRALSSDYSQLRKMVSFVGERRLSYEEYIALSKKKQKTADTPDFKTARFYIPETSLDRAKRVYNGYSASLFNTVLICLFCISVTVCLIMLSPSIVAFVNSSLAA